MAGVTEVARFDNLFDAHRLVAILCDAGVEAEVEGEHTAALLGAVGAVGVRVVVADEDVTRAQEVVAADAQRPRAAAAEEAGGDPDRNLGGPDVAAPRAGIGVAAVARSGRNTVLVLVLVLAITLLLLAF